MKRPKKAPEHLKSIMEFPPRQKVNKLSVKKALEKVQQQMGNPKAGNN